MCVMFCHFLSSDPYNPGAERVTSSHCYKNQLPVSFASTLHNFCYFHIQECPTRWGSSMHNIIARILEEERAIRQVLFEDQKVSHLV